MLVQDGELVEIGVTKDVIAQIVVIGCDPACVNTEEESEFLCEIGLLNVCS